jgi:1-acyl-sn-glycerol-3-phosphate acyltransferase
MTIGVSQRTNALVLQDVLSSEGTDKVLNEDGYCSSPTIINVTEGQPPFERDDMSHHLSQTIKTYAMGISLLMPLRMIVLFASLSYYAFHLTTMAILIPMGINIKEFLENLLLRPFCRLALYCCSVTTIKRFYVSEKQLEKYRKTILKEDLSTIDRATYKHKDPCLIVANHVAFHDSAILVHEFGECSFVVKLACESWPIVGILLKQLKALFVGRGQIANQIVQFVNEYYTTNKNTKLIIFPEGTCTNGNHMLHFHVGAFVSGAPVQPIVHRYKYKYFCPGWIGSDDKFYFTRLFSQFNNRLHIVHFPPYFPSEKERADPKLYAENVRRMMVDLSNEYLEESCGKMQLSDLKFVRKVHK